jgi:hypothetical protein
MKRGRKPKFTQEEIDHMKELYHRKEGTRWGIGDIARLYRTTSATVNRAIDGKLPAKDAV